MRKCLLWGMFLAAWLAIVAPAAGSWRPGDPYKMHFPQLPNPTGWDVNFTYPKVLADDWLCTETGPVSDVHAWFSIEGDNTQSLAALLAAGKFHVSIHRDIPAGTITPFSQPGELLWERDFSIVAPDVEIVHWGTGPQGWYDPNSNEVRLNDHFQIFQLNIKNIVDPYIQHEGLIYWLDLSVVVNPPTLARFGWKTSLEHFNDDAVWSDAPLGTMAWHELRDPITQQSLDMAFVITPEPTGAALVVLGVLMIGRRRAA